MSAWNRCQMVIRSLLPKGGFATAVAAVAGGTAASQLLGLALTPIVTRLFTPDAFGVLAAYMAVLLVVQPVIGLRYELSIPLADSDEEALRLLLVSLAVVLSISTLMAVVATLVTTGLVDIPRLEVLHGVVWLLPLGMLLAGLYQSLRYWAIRRKEYRAIALTTLSQAAGRGAVQLATGFLKAGPVGLVLGEIVGQSAGIAKLSKPALGTIRRSGIVWREVAAAARRASSFPMTMAPAALLNGAGMQVPTLLLVSFYGPVVAGWYFVTQRIIALPVQLIGGAMGQVFLGEAAALARDDPAELKRLFDLLSRRLLLVALIPASLLVAFGPWAAAFVLGEDWRQAGVYMQWLSVSFVFKLSYDGLINLAILNRESLSLVWAAIRLLLASAAVYACHRLGLSDVACVASLAFAMAVSYLLKLALWRHAMRARLRQWEKQTA